MRVIGLTGRNASGKGAVADYLKEVGFNYRSLSDVLRQELSARGQEHTREHLIAIGRELRAAGGSQVLAERIVAQLESDQNHVIDSIRHPNEAAYLKEHCSGFELWEVYAASEIRFTRIKSRGRIGDPETLEQFEAFEHAEARRTEESGQDLDGTAELMDQRIVNESSMEALISNIKGALS
jgi:dephospho-CoA kinase